MTDGGLYPGVDIETGPGGDLYYVSLYGPEYGPGAIHRISYDPEAPHAKLTADKTSGATLPLEVHFDAGESTDPQGQALEYEWDLDGNGVFGAPTKTSTATESYAGATNRTPSPCEWSIQTVTRASPSSRSIRATPRPNPRSKRRTIRLQVGRWAIDPLRRRRERRSGRPAGTGPSLLALASVPLPGGSRVVPCAPAGGLSRG